MTKLEKNQRESLKLKNKLAPKFPLFFSIVSQSWSRGQWVTSAEIAHRASSAQDGKGLETEESWGRRWDPETTTLPIKIVWLLGQRVLRETFCSMEGDLACPVLMQPCIMARAGGDCQGKGKAVCFCLSWLQSVSLFVCKGVEHQPRQFIVKQFCPFKHFWWPNMETPLLLPLCLIVDSVGFMIQTGPTYCFRGQGVVWQHFIRPVAISHSLSFFVGKHCSIRVGSRRSTHHSNFRGLKFDRSLMTGIAIPKLSLNTFPWMEG